MYLTIVRGAVRAANEAAPPRFKEMRPMFWQKAISVMVFFAAFILPMCLLFLYVFIWPVLKRDQKQQESSSQ